MAEPDTRALVAAEDRARATLRARRRLEPGQDDTFDVLTPDAARGFVFRLSERIGLAAGPISAMALLAAIVVVTNTILVSVTERTREIGVRRALGASRRDVMAEVLAESGLLAVAGGAVGPRRRRRGRARRLGRGRDRPRSAAGDHGVEPGGRGGERAGRGLVPRAAGDADRCRQRD